MQRSVKAMSLQAFGLAGALVLTFAFLLRSQGVVAELVAPPERFNRQKQADQPKVAIVGAGIGGSFTAYNLRKLLNDSIELHM